MGNIALLAYSGCMGTELFGVADFLLIARRLAAALAPGQHVALQARIVGARAGLVALAGGASLEVAKLARRPDLLVVPGLEIGGFGQWETRLGALADEQALIRRWHGRGVPLASVCIGSFLLAEAGVLDGRRAATAWLFEAEFERRYPRVRLEKGAVLCHDPPATTSGAISSAFDLGYWLAEMHYGKRIARAAGKLALIGGRRASQRPYVDPSLIQADGGTEFSARVQDWLAQRMARPYDLEALAAAFNVSSRTLLRRYRDDTRSTPLAWLQLARVRQAQRLLESSDKSLAQIVNLVGYEDVATFTRLFQRHVGESPARYRRQR